MVIFDPIFIDNWIKNNYDKFLNNWQLSIQMSWNEVRVLQTLVFLGNRYSMNCAMPQSEKVELEPFCVAFMKFDEGGC